MSHLRHAYSNICHTHTDGPTDDGSSSPPTHDTPSPPTHDTPSGGTSSPTSEPSFQSACSAMNDIATKLKNSEFIDEDITCELNGCGDLNCTSQDTNLRIVLHCSPMAVEIQYTDEESSESEIKTFTKSGTLAGGRIEVTVENKGGNVLGFALEVPAFDATVISYTRISLKSCSSGIYRWSLVCAVHFMCIYMYVTCMRFDAAVHILRLCQSPSLPPLCFLFDVPSLPVLSMCIRS